MYKLRHLAFTGILCLSACGTPTQSHGLLNFNVAWPQHPSHFEIKVIPNNTHELVIQVLDTAGQELLTQSLSRQESTQSISLYPIHALTGFPAGNTPISLWAVTPEKGLYRTIL